MAGIVIFHYKILSKLGEGVMGVMSKEEAFMYKRAKVDSRRVQG